MQSKMKILRSIIPSNQYTFAGNPRVKGFEMWKVLVLGNPRKHVRDASRLRFDQITIRKRIIVSNC